MSTLRGLGGVEREPVLELRDWRVSFHTRRGIVRAVGGVSLKVHAGETLAVVGESGSGKSVTQMSWMRLLPMPPCVIEGGSAIFQGRDVAALNAEEVRKMRGSQVGIVFQEPMTALNPYWRVGAQVAEPLLVHKKNSKKEAMLEAERWLDRVGIPDPATALRKYPHEFSGGQRQRILIAMALIAGPKLLIADEPTTALDVTVQAQILALLKDLQRETGLAVVFITHDLGVVAEVADRVAVLYAGRVLETGPVDEIFHGSAHPYTSALLAATPRLDGSAEALPNLPGQTPDLRKVIGGCPFEPRCGKAFATCHEEFPLARAGRAGHSSFCHWTGALR